MRSLAIRHVVGSFLQFDDLLVCKAGPVVHDLHRIGASTGCSGTMGGLVDFAAVDLY